MCIQSAFLSLERDWADGDIAQSQELGLKSNLQYLLKNKLRPRTIGEREEKIENIKVELLFFD